jgi:hypothetical protein
MNNFDSQLASRLHDMVDHEPGAAPSTGILLQQWQGRRTRRRRTVAVVSASCAVLAVGAITAVAVTPGSTPSRPSITAEAASPQLELASAVTTTENTSYKVKFTAGSKNDPGGWGTTEGAFDPATATGYLNNSQPGIDAVYYQRLVNGVLFIGSSGSKKWKQEPSNGRLEYVGALGGAVGASADPNELFQALRELKATITETGAGTYHFESVRPYDDQSAAGSVTLVGDVTLDDHKRIAKVTYESTNQGQTKPGVKGGPASYTSTDVVTMELSDYGTPVKVERPTEVVVAK